MSRSVVKSAVLMDVINDVETVRYLLVPQSLISE